VEHVAIGVTNAVYNSDPPFHPDADFPELAFGERSEQPNLPYRLLRALFLRLGFDREHFGTRHWNPLGHLIRPGETVVVKPNFVCSRHAGGGDLFATITHPSVIRALIDYAFIALRGTGRLVVADAPQMDCDWPQLMAAQRLDTIQHFYRDRFGFEVECYDLRNYALIDPEQPGYSRNRQWLAGDPAGSVVVNLGSKSRFYGLDSAKYYGADFDRSQTIRHHTGDVQEYCVARTILDADTILSVPKMKVHKKVGVTLNLKGLVGINTDKNYLIHYRLGTPQTGGDQLPPRVSAADAAVIGVQRWLFDKALARQTMWGDLLYKAAWTAYRQTIKPFRRVSRAAVVCDSGNWHGNDSAWRMAADLAHLVFHADRHGQLHETAQRRMFCVVDGIVGGENDGPLKPSPKHSGCLVAGQNPWAVDLVTARLMGFDVESLKLFREAPAGLPTTGKPEYSTIAVHSDRRTVAGEAFLDSRSGDETLAFIPHPGWIGHVEAGRAA
jgi:uncharacterized protein (DUF362 family)